MKPLITPEQASKIADEWESKYNVFEDNRKAVKYGIEAANSQYADNVVPVIERIQDLLEDLADGQRFGDNKRIQSCLDEINELLKP